MKTVNGPDMLRASLQSCVEALNRRRACDIPEGFIEDYVTLGWLEWHAGNLRPTAVGKNICQQQLDRLRASGAVAAE